MLNSEALQLVYQALWLVLMLSAPPVLAAAVVGLLIALVQAATQIQEQTLQYALSRGARNGGGGTAGGGCRLRPQHFGHS